MSTCSKCQRHWKASELMVPGVTDLDTGEWICQECDDEAWAPTMRFVEEEERLLLDEIEAADAS